MRHFPLLLCLAAVLVAPVALKPRGEKAAFRADRTLILITPHNESIRHEFGRAFQRHYEAKHGRRIAMDFRTPGGTSEITRFVEGEYLAAFRNHWTRTLGHEWSVEVEKAFANPKQKPGADTPAARARAAFLASQAGCKIDVFFGGGAFDFSQVAAKGFLVDSGILAAHPELFGPGGAIPSNVSGEPMWDTQGRWFDSVLSAFGIVSNADSLARLGIDRVPGRWADLADPRFFGEIALANPTQSSSVNKSFEMLIQQQMLDEVARHAGAEEKEAIAAGWTNAMRLLQRIGANARYFTDASTKIALDVSAGDCAAGMTIDFYGRFQSEATRRADGSSPVHYTNALGGTSITPDPIAIFRGAPNGDVAREFVEFVLSLEGQRLWNWKLGEPGGPEKYALRRLPLRPELYAEDLRHHRSDPEVLPYEQAKAFTYHESWTSPYFGATGFIFRVMCIDAHDELRAAWRALIDARFPPQASAAFAEVSRVDYAQAGGPIKATLAGKKIDQVRLARELTDHFRTQYARAAQLAREGQ